MNERMRCFKIERKRKKYMAREMNRKEKVKIQGINKEK